jgi:hypothetical protein
MRAFGILEERELLLSLLYDDLVHEPDCDFGRFFKRHCMLCENNEDVWRSFANTFSVVCSQFEASDRLLQTIADLQTAMLVDEGDSSNNNNSAVKRVEQIDVKLLHDFYEALGDASARFRAEVEQASN